MRHPLRSPPRFALRLLALAPFVTSCLTAPERKLPEPTPTLERKRRVIDKSPELFRKLGLTPEQVRAVVVANSSAVHGCYQTSSARRRGTVAAGAGDGGVTVAFSIAPDGSVSSATVVSDTIGWPELAECMLNVFRGMTFRAAEKPTNAVFPFVFRAPR